MTHSAAVTSGILSLMHLCPKEAAHLRKELLIAARHIFATDLRQSKCEQDILNAFVVID